MVSVASQAVIDRVQRLYPWMSESLMDSYGTEWAISESEGLALAAVRDTDEYQAQFRGNYDPETGSVRMAESDYMASKAAFEATIVSVNLNPEYFEEDFYKALENEISPRELIGRMEAAYERVIQSSDAIKQYYSENFGIELTDSAILASAINPDVGQQILDRKIAVAEIGGEASARGYDIGIGFGERLAQAGVDRQSAGAFFGEASNLIPAMQTLSARHADPDDPFDLEDVSSAFLFDDPETRRRMRRLASQESSLFGGGSFEVARGQGGGVSGLGER